MFKQPNMTKHNNNIYLQGDITRSVLVVYHTTFIYGYPLSSLLLTPVSTHLFCLTVAMTFFFSMIDPIKKIHAHHQRGEPMDKN